MLRAADMAHIDEVQSAAGVSLMGEGFQMVETDAIVESFARHLMTAFDKWNERGFEPIARDYLERVPKAKAGERRGIDANGDLLTSLPSAKGRRSAPALSMPWRRSRGTIATTAARNSDEPAMLKLPRTIRLDPSDTFVFERAAEPGEWAVSGAFVFWDRDPAALAPKQRVALRSGFLGIDSLGWSTLAIVTEASEAERDAAVAQLASQLLARFGAPDADAARTAAEAEVAFAASLCDHAPQTLLAVQRTVEDGEIRERFRTLRPRELRRAPIRCMRRRAHSRFTRSRAATKTPSGSICAD